MGTWLAEHAIAAAISIVASILATVLAKKAGSLIDIIESKTNIDIDDKVEVRIQQIVRKVVLSVSQTFVSGLKKKGKFTEEKKKEALKKAIKEAGSTILYELGIEKSVKSIKLEVESEIGEQKEVANILKAKS